MGGKDTSKEKERRNEKDIRYLLGYLYKLVVLRRASELKIYDLLIRATSEIIANNR